MSEAQKEPEIAFDDSAEYELERLADDDNGHAYLLGRTELLRIARAEREIERLKAILAAITDTYRQRIERHEMAIAHHRDSLRQMLEHGERISFPDIGTAYLTTVRARIEVTDKAVAGKVAEELGLLTYVADMKKLKDTVMHQITDGTGEIPPGLAFVPERKSVTVKRR